MGAIWASVVVACPFASTQKVEKMLHLSSCSQSRYASPWRFRVSEKAGRYV